MARVKVTRSFFERGVQRNAGDVVEVSATFARELCAGNKAQMLPDVAAPAPAAAPAATMTTQSAGALVKDKAAAKETT